MAKKSDSNNGSGVVETPVTVSEVERLVQLGYTQIEAEAMLSLLQANRAELDRGSILAALKEGKTISQVVADVSSFGSWTVKELKAAFGQSVVVKRGTKPKTKTEGGPAKKRERITKEEKERREGEVFAALSGPLGMKDLKQAFTFDPAPIVKSLVQAGKVKSEGRKRNMTYQAI